MGFIGQDEDHLESPGTPSCDSLQTSNPMQSSGVTHHLASKSRGVRAGRTSNPPGSRSGIGFPSRVINPASYSWSSSRPSRGDWDLLEVSHLASLLIGLGRTTLAVLECIKNMSTISGPVSDMLMTVKSREVQRGMLAEMRGDRPSAARHFLAAAHLELVLAADFDEIGDADLAVQSRLSAASCFWRAGDPLSARGLIENLLESHPERAAIIRGVLDDLEQNVSP